MLKERLNLLAEWSDIAGWLENMRSAQRLRSNADDYEKAWIKFQTASTRSLLTLVCYFAEDHQSAKLYGKQCLEDCNEFFFGTWRSQFTTSDKTIDATWWKRRFIWMQIFEAALLWGSVLGQWEFLKKVGTFPEPDSCISDGYRPQDRDLYVALGAFLREAPSAELETLLERASTASKKSCKLLVPVIRACLARDTALLQKALIEYLKYYKKNEFPKENITKKISIEGTFFVHWAEKEKLAINVPPEFADHIVRLK
jgi:hypothetical protein